MDKRINGYVDSYRTLEISAVGFARLPVAVGFACRSDSTSCVNSHKSKARGIVAPAFAELTPSCADGGEGGKGGGDIRKI